MEGKTRPSEIHFPFQTRSLIIWRKDMIFLRCPFIHYSRSSTLDC